MVTHKSIPQYRRLYEILRKHILDGVYKEGDLLPSENELCQLYGMTRPTVRQALGTLANDGYIQKASGKRKYCPSPAKGDRNSFCLRNNISTGRPQS